MLGTNQRSAKTRAKTAKLHSIATVARGRNFEGSLEVGAAKYGFSYKPTKATVTGRRLELSGNVTVIDGRPNARVTARNQRGVRATLISAQGGIGAAPPRKKLPAEIADARPDLPVVESTGSLSFCGALYLKLAPLDGRALGVPADLTGVQLNVRLAPRSDLERELQSAYSSIVDALYGKDVDGDAASRVSAELNRLLSGD